MKIRDLLRILIELDPEKELDFSFWGHIFFNDYSVQPFDNNNRITLLVYVPNDVDEDGMKIHSELIKLRATVISMSKETVLKKRVKRND